MKVAQAITDAKKGDQIAFNFLLDTFWNSVYNFQLKRIKNENDAEDVTIRTFSKAFDRIDTFDERYKFETWLITISKNIHIDLMRKQNASINIATTEEQEQKALEVVDGSPTPEDKLITEQNLAQLLQFIKQLKPAYQQIINLRYFQERSYKEIAQILNEPMNNVKVKLLRAKKLLAEIINNYQNG
ncbi:sigma-70 family RNA polymerase sigma factor [Spongiivirga sp. MCCC 1A20706]|uniref:RNA polymerase sigma factor n=1 Tax=Spongiivirga sp. MCCC 1A20706 TaxID=3160963 RepID=UPI003977A743